MNDKQVNEHQISSETILYLLAALLALIFRLLNLGKAPLSDAEANWALQALDVARGNSPAVGAQPAYVLLTGVLIAIFKDTNTLTRLFPALAGSLLVLLPFYLTKQFESSSHLRRAGIVFAFGLALDPGLVTASRTAGSIIPAITFTLLAPVLFLSRRYISAGILTGLALLSGPGILHGGIGLLLAYTTAVVISYSSKVDFSELLEKAPESSNSGLKSWAAASAITFGCTGTLFLVVPQGLSGFGQLIPEYLNGWFTTPGVPLLRLPASLLVYQPLMVLFGIIGIATSWLPVFNNSGTDFASSTRPAKAGRVFSLWLVASLLLILLYPGRSLEDLCWVLIPFWGLAAIELARYLTFDPEKIFLPAAVGLAALMAMFLLMIWYNLLRLNIYQADLNYYLILIGSIFLMAVIISVLIAAGWSALTSLQGLVWGINIVLSIYLVFQTWGLSQIRPNSPRELWHNGPATVQAEALTTTLVDLSTWETGQRYELDITVTADLPSLRWALRDFPHVHYKTILDEQELSPVIITPGEQTSPSLVVSYRGQDFIWQTTAGWTQAVPSGNLVRWFAFREAPEIPLRIILWGRNDLYPGGWLEPAAAEAPVPVLIPPEEGEIDPSDLAP